MPPTTFILVPLDGSEAGEDALPYARALSRRLRLPIHLLSVVEMSATWRSAGGHHTRQWLEHPALRTREHYLQVVAGRLAHDGLPASIQVVSGDPALSILQRARPDEAECVALSTHGRGGVERLLLGSVADKVMRLSRVPVLLARRSHAAEPQLAGLERIAVPLDGSAAAQMAIPAAARLVRDGGTLTLVRVAPLVQAVYEHYLPEVNFDETDRELVEAATAYLEDAGRLVPPEVQVQTVVLRGPVAATLQQWARDERIDLLVMTSHGLGGWRRLLVGSVAERLVRQSVAVLLIHPQAADGATAPINAAVALPNDVPEKAPDMPTECAVSV